MLHSNITSLTVLSHGRIGFSAFLAAFGNEWVSFLISTPGVPQESIAKWLSLSVHTLGFVPETLKTAFDALLTSGDDQCRVGH